MITKTKALVKNSKATRGKGRDGLLMSERLLIGAYTNPQDAACDQSLDVTHDEYCSTEMSSVGPYRRARHVAAGHTRVCGMSDSDHRLHVKLGFGAIARQHRRAISNLRSLVRESGRHLEILLPRVLKYQLILLFFFASTLLLPHARRSHENTQKSSTTNN
jgi:hypothetical protein